MTIIRPLYYRKSAIVCATLAAIMLLLPAFSAVSVHSASASLAPASCSSLADFGLSVTEQVLTVPAGSSVDLNVTVVSVNGFSGSIDLSSTVSPGGVTARIIPASVTLGAGETAESKLTVSTTSSTPLQSYVVIVKGISGSLSHSESISVSVAGPSFSVSVSPVVLEFQPGSSGSAQVNVTGLYQFAGSVMLAPMVFGVNLTASLNPSTVIVPSGSGTAFSILTASSTSATTPGYYPVEIDGVSGALSESDSILVIITRPGFEIASNPENLTIQNGSSGSSNITVSSLNGFAGSVFLYLAPMSGVNATLELPAVTLDPGGFKTLRLSVMVPAGTSPGPYFVYVEGAAGAAFNSTLVLVIVPGPDFDIGSNPGLLALSPGATASSTISLTSLYGFTGTVGLSLLCTPGVSATIAPDSVSVDVGGQVTSSLAVLVSSYTLPGSYIISVGGTSGLVVHSSTVLVRVTASPMPGFIILATGPISFVSGSTSSTTVTITSLNGFTGTVSLNSAPSPTTGLIVTCDLPALLPAGGTSTTKCTLNSSTEGSYTVSLVGTSGSKTNSTSIEVIVEPLSAPHFIISAQGSVTVAAGSSGTATVTVTGLNGFAGTVSLSASVFPIGPEVSVSPASLAVGTGYGNSVGSITVKVTVPSSLSPGNYTVTVTATSLSDSRTASVPLVVTRQVTSSPPQGTSILGLDPTLFYAVVGVLTALIVSTVGVLAWKRSVSRRRPSRSPV